MMKVLFKKPLIQEAESKDAVNINLAACQHNPNFEEWDYTPIPLVSLFYGRGLGPLVQKEGPIFSLILFQEKKVRNLRHMSEFWV